MQRILIFLVLFALSCSSHSDEPPQQVRYQQIQERFFYQVELLQHALNLTAKEYGEAKLFANSTSLKKYVGIPDEVALARGLVDVIFSATSEK